jgi:hypothetical protein
MLCYVCLIENRDTTAVTHAQGTAVCREHVRVTAPTTVSEGGNGQDLMSLIFKIQEAANLFKQFKERNNNNVGIEAAGQHCDNPGG